MHCVDLGESFLFLFSSLFYLGEIFQMSIYLQQSASIQPRTSPVKFARSPYTGSFFLAFGLLVTNDMFTFLIQEIHKLALNELMPT